MAFIIGLMAACSAFLITISIGEMIEKKKESQFNLYDDLVSNLEAEDRVIKSIEERTFLEKIQLLLKSSNLPLEFNEFLVFCGAIFAFTTVIMTSLMGNLIIGAIIGTIPLIILYMYMQQLMKNRNSRVVQQLPDFAVTFASGYEAGFSIENCFQYCSENLRYPINEEMTEIHQDITLRKLTMDTALKNWYERNPNVDILFVIKGLVLCQSKSGNVTTIMGSLQEKLRERAFLDRFVQKRTQSLRFIAKFIQFVPIAAYAFGFISNPGKFMAFATSFFGVIAIGVSIFCFIAGTLIIRKFIADVYKD